jgi:hypothetical protein
MENKIELGKRGGEWADHCDELAAVIRLIQETLGEKS